MDRIVGWQEALVSRLEGKHHGAQREGPIPERREVREESRPGSPGCPESAAD